MSVIKITVDDQNLHITDSPKIAAQGVNENQVEFTFSADWDGFGKIALFYREEDEDTVYESAIDEDGKALVPHEVTDQRGKICIGVAGVKDDVIHTSEILKYKVVNGLYTAGESSQPPTPGIYEQMLALIGNIQTEQTDFINDINDLIDNTPYLTTVEDEEFELPVHTINDSETADDSTWSSEKIADYVKTEIANSKKWAYLGDYVGKTLVSVPSEFYSEVMITAQFAAGDNYRAFVTFHVDLNTGVFRTDKDTIIAHTWESVSNGYAAIRCHSDNPSDYQIGLDSIYDGTTNVIATAPWTIYAR